VSTGVTRALALAMFACLLLAPAAGLASTPRAHQTAASDPTSRVMPRLVSDGAGGAIVVWLDQSGGNSLVRARRVASDGTPYAGWPADDVLVSPASGWFDDISALPDGAGGAWVAWDNGTPFGEVGLHRISANGATALVWKAGDGTSGARSTTPDTSVTPGPQKFRSGNAYPAMTSDGADGVFYAYVHGSELLGGELYVQRYAGSGSVTNVWSAALGISTIWAPGGYPTICADDSGGAYVAWSYGLQSVSVIRIARVTANGTFAPGWSQDGEIVCAVPAAAPRLVPDGAGGAIVGWSDSRDPTHDQVFAQRVHADGSLAWATDGVAVCSLASQFGPTRFGWYGDGDGRHGQVVADGVGGALFTWVDLREGASPGLSNVYAQRITGDGAAAPGWPLNGAPVCRAAGDQALPNLAADGAGGAYVSWQDGRADPAWSLRWQHLDPSGDPALDQPVDGALASLASASTWMPALVSDGGQGAFVAWSDATDSLSAIRVAHLTTGAGGSGRLASSLSLATDVSPARESRTITLTARVQPPTAVGSVDFFDFGQRFATVPVLHGSAQTSRLLTTVGSRTFVASYTGDATYSASDGYVVQQTIARVATDLRITSSENPTLVNRALTLRATAPATATGSIEFFEDSTSIGVVAVAAGLASVPYAAAAMPSTRSLSAAYSGDTLYAPARVALPEVVYTRFPTTVTLAGPPNPCRQLDATFTATVSPPSATGTIHFSDDTTLIANVPIVGGVATLPYRAARYSMHHIDARYGGDVQYATSSTSVTENFVGQPSTTALASSPASGLSDRRSSSWRPFSRRLRQEPCSSSMGRRSLEP
jgi:Bacterial Ig-like domain (group 3)